MEEKNKNVDESWKDSAEKEKHNTIKEHEHEMHIPEANFGFFATTLGLQASISLGDIPNPSTNKKEENLDQAKYIIDTLEMLKDKTKNNLSKEESELLESILYDLRLRYVSKKERINT